MKKKIFVLTMLISVFVFIIQLCGSTLACMDEAYWVSEYVSNNNSTHQFLRRCPTCGQVMNGTAGVTESHYAYYYSNRNDGTHNAICICKKVISTGLAHTWGKYIQISNTQCQRTCTATSCGATETVNHNFVNGKCSYCGASDRDNMVEAKPTSEAPQYYRLENTSTKAITVTVDIFGPKVYSSASNPARKISFTDSVPAGTIRYYFVYTRGSGSSRRIIFGYKDSTETTGHTLAIVMQDYRDNGKNLNFQMNGESTYNIAFGNEVGSWVTTTATGSTISYKPAISGTTYLYTALNSDEKDYSYRGFNGKITSSNSAPASLISVDSHADASLPYGKVSLSYEIPHEHSWGAWTTTKAATCTTEGVQKRTCSGCSQTETKTIKPLGHSYTAACPTCKGANAKCSRCSAINPNHTCTIATPSVTLKANGSTYSGAWTNQNVIATLSATNATSYQYSTDGTNWLTASSLSMSGTAGTITFSGDRNNTVYFRSVLTSSVVSSKTSGSTIKIDKTAPTVTLSASSVISGTAVTITLGDTASGVNAWQVTTSSTVSASSWTSITATNSTTVKYTPTSAGTYYIWVKDVAGNMKFTTLSVGQATPPTVTATQISTNNINWEGWILQGDAYIDSEGNLICPSANSGAYKWFLVDGHRWTIELSHMVTTTGTKQGAYMNAQYYTDTFATATAQNSYTSNGWAADSLTTGYKTSKWTGYEGYGPSVKYVRILVSNNASHTTVPVKYKPPKFSSELDENYVGVKLEATANSGSLSSLKYLWSKSTSGVTEAQITNVATSGQVVYPPYGAKGTYCLWVLAQNSNGGKIITKTDTYTIDNPEIELSLGTAGGGTRLVNAYIFNQENRLTNPSVGVSNKGTTTSSSYSSGPVGSVESATSSFYGSKAFLLKKTGTNYQWHGIQSSHDFLGNLPANTYIVVSSNYNTTAAAGQTKFTSNWLYNSSWTSACSQTSISKQNQIYEDGVTHHTHDIIKTNAAITESTSIMGSGMPDWAYSNQVGSMTVDGIQWFVFSNFDDGISVKKYAYGDKDIVYFRDGGTAFTGNSFAANKNGTYTVYTKTDNGVERIKTVEVTGVDNAQPDVTITNNGSSVSTDPSFATGLNGLKVYNNAANAKVSLTRAETKDAPNTSGYAMHIKTNGEAQPGHGGFTFEHVPTADKQYVIKFVARIPTGYTLNFATNSIGASTQKWMTPTAGTGDWETYLFYVKAGSSGTFSSTNYFYLTGGSTATESAPVEWDVAYANAYSTTAISWTNQNVTITGKAKDTEDGIVAYGFAYSSEESENVTAPTSWTTITATTSEVTATATADKNGAYYFFAKDANGNISKTATYVQRIDKGAPTAGTVTMKLGSSTGSDYTSGTKTKENVYISLVNGSDALSGHKSTTYQVTGANTVVAGTTAATTLTKKGTSTITVTTTDNAGNVSTRTYTVVMVSDPILMAETYVNAFTNKYILGNSTIAQRRTDVATISIEDVLPSTLPSGAWDVSKAKDNSVYAWLTVNASDSAKYDLHIVADGNVIASSGDYLFANYTNCTSITGLDKLNTSNVTNMSYMFRGCSGLTSLDVSKFNTSNVTNMTEMFYECSSLTSLDVSSFDTSNVTDMSYMFAMCSSLTSIDVSNFNTSKVTNMSKMFECCSSLTSLDVSSFDTSNVTNMSYMLYKCSSLTSLDVTGFDTSNVTDMSWMFAVCSSLTNLDVNNFNTNNVTKMLGMFDRCKNITSLDVSSFNTNNVTNMYSMFFECSSLTNLNLGNNFDTSKVTNMAYMFDICSSLTSLNLGNNFDTSKVTNMNAMFANCSSLTSIPTGLDLSNTAITSNDSTSNGYACMFNGCSSLTSATINSKYIGYQMFYGCNKLTNITITSDVQGVYNDGTEMPSGAFKYTGGGTLTTVLNSSSTVITKDNYDWAADNRVMPPASADETIVDKTAPILKSHNITDTMVVPGTITITAVLEDPEVEPGVPGSGVNASATRYAITDTNVAPTADASIWQESNKFTTSSRAIVYIWIKAVDNVGNVRIIGEMKSDRTSLNDTTAPTIDSIKVTYEEINAILTIKATDTGSGIDKITVNGKELDLTRDGNSATGDFEVTEEGTYVIVVSDVLGNENTATRTAYEIKYDGNTAEAGSVPMQIKINGVDRKLNMNTFTKVMYKFENWNTLQNGTGDTYAEGAIYSADKSVIMYAQWICTEIPIQITKQPEDVELIEGESTVVSVEATGSNIVYKWQISEDGGTSWNDIAGETKSTLNLKNATLEMSGNKYRCVLSNYYGDVISDAMTLTVNVELEVGELELRKDTINGTVYDVDIWTKSVVHVKMIPGVGGTTTYMSLAGSAQTVEETSENSIIRTSGVTVLRVKTAKGSAEVFKDYIIKIDRDAPIGGTITLDGKQREDDSTIKLKATGFADEHSGIAQYVWEYKSNKEASYRQGKIDKSGNSESYFEFDADDNTTYAVRIVVYDNVGNSVTVVADKEFSLIGTSVKMKPTIRFTNIDKIVINEDSGNKEVRAKVIFKASSPLTKIVIDGNLIDVSTITPKMIGKEYVYETTYVITSNGVYVASCEDSDGGKAKEEVAISAFNDPFVRYKIVESGTYKEIEFTATVPVKIFETTPSKYKPEVVTDSGEYSFINKMVVTEDEIDINFVFEDEYGNESNTVNVKIEAVIGKSKFVRAVDDRAGNKYEPFEKMNVDTAYRIAQEMENKIATINSKVVSYYGTNNGQVDMFMSRARDIGATVYLMNASKAGTYDGKMIKDLGGSPTSEVATYGLQGVGTKEEYTAAYVKGVASNSLTEANIKYKDVIISASTLRLYKGFAMADYPSVGGSIDTGFIVRTAEKAYTTQNGETNTNSSFRITLINK